jgi:hypothetical protein
MAKARAVRQATPKELRHTKQPNSLAQKRARVRNIAKARNAWMAMPKEKRSEKLQSKTEGAVKARRENIEIARKAWLKMKVNRKAK